jgi:transposase-like protein
MVHTRTSREKRLDQVRRWQTSGLSAAEYGRRHGIAAGTLAWWRWKLRAEGVSLRTRAPRRLPFVEITPPESPLPSREPLELQLADVRLRIPADFDEGTLSRVLGVLRGAR